MANADHKHSLPVQVTVIDDSDERQIIVHRELNVYRDFNGLIFPKEKVVLNSNSPISPTGAPFIPAQPYDPLLYRKVYETDYDAVNNIRKVRKDSDIPTAYLWGYSQKLLVAEVKNAVVEEVWLDSFEDNGDLFTDANGANSAKTGLKVRNTSTYTFSPTYQPVESNTLMSYWFWQNAKWNYSGIVSFQRTFTTSGSNLDEVRAFPMGSQMSTYAYDPSRGIISESDANGSTQYYLYDERGRLSVVKDDDRNILKTFTYHFRQ
ncbi:MAG TPA: hypothetical protein VK517_00120 [Cyclobacteriaceae bacterium]|nr:hypothetical protein [Cyclobacteriaceae bacterium]